MPRPGAERGVTASASPCRYSDAMIRQRQHVDATRRTVRLEAFTDGVFAIAATLLVLDLTTHTLGTVDSDADMWAALGGMGELFVNFVLSFVLLCMLWMVHVQQFEHIAQVDPLMLWLNNARLLFIVLVPFATGLMTQYEQYYAGRIAMPATFFLAILVSWLQWQWAARHREVMLPDMSASDAAAYGRGSLSALVISGAVVILSPWIGSIAFLLFLLDGPLTRLLRGKGA